MPGCLQLGLSGPESSICKLLRGYHENTAIRCLAGINSGCRRRLALAGLRLDGFRNVETVVASDMILATESRKDSPLSPSRRSKSFASNSRYDFALNFDDRQPNSANRLRANNAKLLGISSRRLRLLARHRWPRPSGTTVAETLWIQSRPLDSQSLPRGLLFRNSPRMVRRRVRASGYEDAKGFVVMAGSEMVSGETISIHQHISTLRKNLIEQGVVQAQDDQSLFAEDHVFPSPSTAAGVILGRSTDGRKDWKTAEGVTLKQLQTTDENNEDV